MRIIELFRMYKITSDKGTTKFGEVENNWACWPIPFFSQIREEKGVAINLKA